MITTIAIIELLIIILLVWLGIGNDTTHKNRTARYKIMLNKCYEDNTKTDKKLRETEKQLHICWEELRDEAFKIAILEQQLLEAKRVGE